MWSPEGVAPSLAASVVAQLVEVECRDVHALGLAGPDHERLGRAWDPAVARRLLRLNWVRTVAWSAHAAVVLVLLGQAG